MMKDQTFQGFTPQTFQFLSDLEENNNKEWFDAHKPVYQSELINPLKALFQTLYAVMQSVDPLFEMRPHRAISRIYRDIRFSQNKDPYKTCMWMTFQQPISSEEWKDFPGYFMEFRKDNYTLGMGLFQPKKKVMDSFRDAIIYEAQEFRRNTEEAILGRGYTISGEEYKKPIANELDEYFQPWIQRKGVWVQKTMPVSEVLYSNGFADVVLQDFLGMEWLYGFMKEAVE